MNNEIVNPELVEELMKEEIGKDGARKVRAILEILAIGGDVSIAHARNVPRAAENAMELRSAVRSSAEN